MGAVFKRKQSACRTDVLGLGVFVCAAAKQGMHVGLSIYFLEICVIVNVYANCGYVCCCQSLCAAKFICGMQLSVHPFVLKI